MPNNPLYNLTAQKISFTFQNLLQTDGFGNYYTGLGDEIYIAQGATGATGTIPFYYQGVTPSPDPSVVGARWIDTDNEAEYVWVYDGVTYSWMQPIQVGRIQYRTLGVTGSSLPLTFNYEYYGVGYTGGVCTLTLPLGSSPVDDGKFLTVSDESGGISNWGRGITVGGSGGQTINGESSVSMKINRMSLTFLFRNNSWKMI